MIVIRRVLVGLAAATAMAVAAPPAPAVPPPHDDYLQSTRVTPPFSTPREMARDLVDLTEATVQSDLFGPGGGGGPEPTDCNGVRFGRTVWYDVIPDQPGQMEVQTSGADVAIALHRFDQGSSRIVESIGCVDERGPSEDVFFVGLEKGRAYTVQIGGVDEGSGPAGGQVQVTFDFFPDRDEDGIFDALDKCPTRPGVKRFGGCVPRLNSRPAFSYRDTADGVRLTALAVAPVPAGAGIRLRCTRGCNVSQSLTAPKRTLSKMVGRALKAGDRFEIRVTRGATRRPGRFRFGAVGQVFRFEVGVGSLSVTERCTLPGSGKQRKRCR